MNKQFIIILFVIYSFNASNILNEEVYEPLSCFPSILKKYIDVDTSETRQSFKATSEMANQCKNFKDSCCSNDEFAELTNSAIKNLELIYINVRKFIRIIDLIVSAPQEKFDQIYEKNFTSKNESDEQKFQETIKSFKENHQAIKDNIKSAYDFYLEYNGGANCAICNAKNHSQFKLIYDKVYEKYETKMIVDVKYLKSLINSSFLNNYLENIKISNLIINFTNYLSPFYSYHNKLDLISQEEIESMDYTLTNCRNVEDFITSSDCLDFYFGIFKFNKISFLNLYQHIDRFFVYSSDFFGDQFYVNQNNIENKDEEIDQSQNYHLSLQDQLDIENRLWGPRNIMDVRTSQGYIVESENDLEFMDILPAHQGWNLQTQGIKNWRPYFEFVNTLPIISIGLILTNLI